MSRVRKILTFEDACHHDRHAILNNNLKFKFVTFQVLGQVRSGLFEEEMTLLFVAATFECRFRRNGSITDLEQPIRTRTGSLMHLLREVDRTPAENCSFAP